MRLLAHDTKNLPLFQRAARMVTACDDLLDVGCGIRPQNLVPCKRHVCAEPHGEYADVLEQNGFDVIRATANDAISQCDRFDTIVALDVIEHMTREDGERFIDLAQHSVRRQVVVFTPLGFMPQDGGNGVDAWGMQGQQWQAHRSGWTPDDFAGWNTITDAAFHQRNGKTYGAFFAIYG
jgi:hypothetical protein